MLQREEGVLDYKISPIYTKKITELAADSKVSFDNFQTPGWTSIMHTETSPAHTKPAHNKILEKLSRLRDVDLSQSSFSRIRVPDSTKSNNILIYEQQKHLIQHSDSRSSKKENNQRNSLGPPSNPRLSDTHQRQPTPNSLKNSSTSHTNKPTVIIKQKPALSHNQSTQSGKRFNQITVHEHLYLDGIKQSNKRIMEQILDEQYKKENVLPFHPHINPKSQQLAEIKFSRVQESTEIQLQLQEEMKKSTTTKRPQNLIEDKQQNRYKVINRLFYFLSRGETAISKETIKTVVEQLPLMCLRTLEKVLEKLYAGTTYTWLQFLAEMNNRKVVSNKQALINIFEKWQSRMDNKQSHNIAIATAKP